MQPLPTLRQGLYARGAHLYRRPLQKYDAYCITDEVYEHIVYAPHEHVYMARCPACSSEPSAAVRCPRRTPSPAGVLATPLPRPGSPERIKKVHDFLTVGAAAPLQEAVVTALNFDGSYYDEVLDLYTAKRDLFCQGLDSIGLKHKRTAGRLLRDDGYL